MDLIKTMGMLAATETRTAFIPPVLQIIKTQNTKGISLVMYVIFTLGIIFWQIYGILLGDIPLLMQIQLHWFWHLQFYF